MINRIGSIADLIKALVSHSVQSLNKLLNVSTKSKCHQTGRVKSNLSNCPLIATAAWSQVYTYGPTYCLIPNKHLQYRSKEFGGWLVSNYLVLPQQPECSKGEIDKVKRLS